MSSPDVAYSSLPLEESSYSDRCPTVAPITIKATSPYSKTVIFLSVVLLIALIAAFVIPLTFGLRKTVSTYEAIEMEKGKSKKTDSGELTTIVQTTIEANSSHKEVTLFSANIKQNSTNILTNQNNNEEGNVSLEKTEKGEIKATDATLTKETELQQLLKSESPTNITEVPNPKESRNGSEYNPFTTQTVIVITETKAVKKIITGSQLQKEELNNADISDETSTSGEGLPKNPTKVDLQEYVAQIIQSTPSVSVVVLISIFGVLSILGLLTLIFILIKRHRAPKKRGIRFQVSPSTRFKRRAKAVITDLQAKDKIMLLNSENESDDN